jgi:hypothetical protein
MRAPRLRKKSKMGGFAVIRFATVAHGPSATARGAIPISSLKICWIRAAVSAGRVLVEYPGRLLLMSL